MPYAYETESWQGFTSRFSLSSFFNSALDIRFCLFAGVSPKVGKDASRPDVSGRTPSPPMSSLWSSPEDNETMFQRFSEKELFYFVSIVLRMFDEMGE
jgi:hypothetical protein